MKKLLILAACTFISLPAMADRWVPANINVKTAILYNASTLEVNGNIRGTWVLSVNPTTQHGVDFFLRWIDVDCGRKMYRTNYILISKIGSNSEP